MTKAKKLECLDCRKEPCVCVTYRFRAVSDDDYLNYETNCRGPNPKAALESWAARNAIGGTVEGVIWVNGKPKHFSVRPLSYIADVQKGIGL